MNIQDNNNIPKKPGIYKITNIKNNKNYIGSSINMKNRIKKHYYELNNNVHNNKYLLRSYNKYGEKYFFVEILEIFDNITKNKLLKIEEKYIILYDSLKNGYNLILNNKEHFKKINKSENHIQNNRKKDSISVIAFNRFNGKKVKEFNSITEASYFFKTSTSNISRVCKNKLNYIKNHTFCYKKEYDENKDYSKPEYWSKNYKKSKSHLEKIKKKNQERLGRKIYKYNLNYKLINIYNSRAEAERENNLKKESLRNKAGNKTPFKGYYWLYNKI